MKGRKPAGRQKKRDILPDIKTITRPVVGRKGSINWRLQKIAAFGIAIIAGLVLIAFTCAAAETYPTDETEPNIEASGGPLAVPASETPPICITLAGYVIPIDAPCCQYSQECTQRKAAAELAAWRALLAQEQETLSAQQFWLSSASSAYTGSGGGSWDSVAQCESRGDWGISSGNGFYGGLQFDSGTWDAYGNSAYAEANMAPREEQIAAANRMPYDGWPNC